jgi:signal transduction histidine kinase
MGISGYISYAIKNIDEGEPREMLGRAQKEVERIARIVRSMLVFGRQSDPNNQKADVLAGLDTIGSLLEAEYKAAGIVLRIESSAALPVANINTDSLQQVFLNLLLNARDSLKDRPEPREVTIKAGVINLMIEIAVCDNGPGVPAEILSRIFDPFFTTKPPGSGTGLGLAVSRQMMEEVHGTLEYQAVSSGACFILRLPAVKDAALE